MDLPRFVELATSLRIETPRLVLRRVVASDRQILHEHERDRGIMEWVRDPDAAADTDARVDRMSEFFAGHAGPWLAMAIADRRDLASSLLGLLCENRQLGGQWRDEYVDGLLRRECPLAARVASAVRVD